ncbi:MAG: hypothetical protein DRP42_00490 [Tenericutes bacterium]|nr:MAG: hypothetical protein DRP42_00490 [Mycoplasmatota bacterium]
MINFENIPESFTTIIGSTDSASTLFSKAFENPVIIECIFSRFEIDSFIDGMYSFSRRVPKGQTIFLERRFSSPL